MSTAINRFIRALAITIAVAALAALAGCGPNLGSQQSASPPPPPSPTATLPPSISASLTPTKAVPTSTPASTPMPALPTATATAIPPAAALPLHTEGTRIVDARGHMVTLASVNWYGAEGSGFVPGGLDKRPYMDILLTIRSLGFNSVRIPFSNELVERNPRVYEHLAANKELIGLHALDIMDAILNGARRVGLMVILDDHRSDAGWTAETNGLWYIPGSSRYTQQGWIADWVTLAKRYSANPAVIGFDLRNEPHTSGGVEVLSIGYMHNGATWGPFQGVDNPLTDWRLAAQQAGDAILAVDPHALIFVEGIEIYPTKITPGATYCPGHAPPMGAYCPDIYWWGGNLRGVLEYPVQLKLPGHLVYSAHEYGPRMHTQRWFSSIKTAADWDAEFTAHWGMLLSQTGPNAAPVWIGEFGTPHSSPQLIEDSHPASQGQWFSALIDYLHRHPAVGWSYWAINGTASGDNPNQGSSEHYGVLGPDWTHVANALLMQKLREIEPGAS